MNDQTANLKRGEKGAILNIAAYLILAAVKLVIGLIYHSEALRADGLNNATDIVASLAVLIGLRISQRPADSDHAYGHYRAETISSLIASFIMMAVGIEVLIGGKGDCQRNGGRAELHCGMDGARKRDCNVRHVCI